MAKKYFVSGIGTDVGKTLVSALLVSYLRADYWKPVQTGTCFGTDSDTIRSLCDGSVGVIHPESYAFSLPASPHFAAEREDAKIAFENIVCPTCDNNSLVIEGAGGLLVPLNDTDFVIDLAKKFDAQVVLVIGSYLGCINHTLLSISYLLSKDIPIHGLVLNGDFEEPVSTAILEYAKREGMIKLLARIPSFREVRKDILGEYLKTSCPFSKEDWL